MARKRMEHYGFRLPSDLRAWLDAEADRLNVDTAELIRDALRRMRREREAWRESELVSPRQGP